MASRPPPSGRSDYVVEDDHDVVDDPRQRFGSSLTMQAIFELKAGQASVTTALQGLKESIDGLSAKMDKVEDLRCDVAVVKTHAEHGKDGFDRLREDFKDFREKQFEPLRTDVSNLRLKWARAAGIGAAIATGVGLFGEIIKLVIEHHWK